ncbi:MAG: M56 family metallopeptidase [Acidobacteriaceae bacterium]
MSHMREMTFCLLFNASLQIGLFAVVAAVLSPLVAKVTAKYQYRFYLAVLMVSLAAPVANTLLHPQPQESGENLSQPVVQKPPQSGHPFWLWTAPSTAHAAVTPGPGWQNAAISTWGLFVLYQLIHFGRGLNRVRRLRKEALPLPPGAESLMAGWLNAGPHRISLFQTATIDVPVTAGVFHSAIVLPSSIVPSLSEQDLRAVLAHEYGHIRRRDFAVHLLCQVLSLTVAWHPGIRYVMSKVSQTREVACDDDAALRLGTRRLYARALLRLASICLHASRGEAVGLGIFDGDNLEERIMRLTEKKSPLSRVRLIGLVLAISTTVGSGAVLARAMSLQTGSQISKKTQAFAGTWHWMFKGQSFATMILVQNSSGFTGTVTESRIALDSGGELSQADPSDNGAPTPIKKTAMEGDALRVTVEDGFEFLVTLKDQTHAEIHPAGAPAIMKPIPAEKAP